MAELILTIYTHTGLGLFLTGEPQVHTTRGGQPQQSEDTEVETTEAICTKNSVVFRPCLGATSV